MLMAEITTAVQHNLPVKIIVLKNNSLAEVKFEQMELGNPSFVVATSRRSTSSPLLAPAALMVIAASALKRYGLRSRRRCVRQNPLWSRPLSTPTRSRPIQMR